MSDEQQTDHFYEWKETQERTMEIMRQAVEAIGKYIAYEQSACDRPAVPPPKDELKELRNEVYLTAHVVQALAIAAHDSVGVAEDGLFNTLKEETVHLMRLRAHQAKLERP